MRKLFVTIAVVGMVVALCNTVLCEEKKQEPIQPEGYGRGWGPGSRMDYGWGPGSGMGYGYGTGLDYSVPGPLYSLKPEDRVKWEKLYAQYLMDTMEMRKEIAVKRIELETLWAQSKVDREKVEKLSNELSELYTKRMKACDNYVIKAREQFGKLGWACPIGRW